MSYPIKSESECFTSYDYNNLVNILQQVDAVKAYLQNAQNSCSDAMAKCDVDSLSLIDASGNEANNFKSRLNVISQEAEALKTQLTAFKNDVLSYAQAAINKDRSLLNQWKSSPDNPANQQNKSQQTVSVGSGGSKNGVNTKTQLL